MSMHSERDCLQFQLSFHQPYYVSEASSKADLSNVSPMFAMGAPAHPIGLLEA